MSEAELENDTFFLSGRDVPGTEVLNTTLIEPVMPIPVFGGDWNLIFRPVIPYINSPVDRDVGELRGRSAAEIAASPRLSSIASDVYGSRTGGLGDSVLLTLLGPNRDDGWVYGLGPTLLIPTATQDVLGNDKWGPVPLVCWCA